jgi:uncharacterized protein YjbI with pentapeptide repeats
VETFAHGTAPGDCNLLRVGTRRACLEHDDPHALDAILDELRAGAPLDANGTRLRPETLALLLDATPRTAEGRPELTAASFEGTRFLGAAVFDGVRFARRTSFARAQFAGYASFGNAAFDGWTRFQDARFHTAVSFREVVLGGSTNFDDARFDAGAAFDGARCGELVSYGRATFRGYASFSDAHFAKSTSFEQARFSVHAAFRGARFAGEASFKGARFGGGSFRGACFGGDVLFADAHFEAAADFEETEFQQATSFASATFVRSARFRRARVASGIVLQGVRCEGTLDFTEANFEAAAQFGPVAWCRHLALDRARFGAAAVIEAAAELLSCTWARFDDSVALRLRGATIILDGTTFARASSISPASGLEGSAAGASMPRLLSVRNVDVTGLVVSDVGLEYCLFQSALCLDRLQIEGAGSFARTPPGLLVGWRWPFVWRWTKRQVLAEECLWRDSRPGGPARVARTQQRWHPGAASLYDRLTELTGHGIETIGPDRLTALYRALRKAEEDAKNEPGAADFYYGEMEMRRLSQKPGRGERLLLTLYWLASGYGLRGSRALVGALAVLVASAMLFASVGFQGATVSADALVAGMLYGARTALGLFPGPQPRLTHWGDVTQIAVRLILPVLLGLAILAVRGRVKR